MTLNLQNYLKKYSTINSNFIDDFFGMYKNNTNETDYVIDLENVVKWLKSRKETIKNTLTCSYIKNIDYKIIKSNKKNVGRPKELILLTPNCFKRLCMSSKTKKAEEVRTYFIEIEKHIDKYKNYIIEGLNKKVGILENNQKNINVTKNGVIYVLKTNFDIDGIYKIGKTKTFKNRLKTHNNSHVNNVDVIFIFETNDIDGVEKCLKLALKTKQYRKRKEFYEVDLDLLKELMKDCENLLLKGKKKSIKNIKGDHMFIMFDN
jgi:phage anti-repressor protein/predicted GIY-YIG superfamily endonuclease